MVGVFAQWIEVRAVAATAGSKTMTEPVGSSLSISK